MYCSCSRIVYMPCPARQTVGTVNIMSCEIFARELADLPSISFNFESLTKEQVIEKVQKALQVCSFVKIVINKQNDIIMKYVEKKLKTVTS